MEIFIPTFPENMRTPKSNLLTDKEKEVLLVKDNEKTGKEMISEMYISLKIKIDGKIKKTNSKHIDKNQISIYDFEYKKIINDNEKYKEIIYEEGNEGRQFDIMKSVDGIILEDTPVIFVEFK